MQTATAPAPTAVSTAPAAPNVSLVVPCRNEALHIRAFLDSVVAQDFTGLMVEMIVADGMSTDGTRRILEEYCALHPFVRMIDNPGKIVSPGLNAAIREARGDIIIRLDAHTEYGPDYVRQCVAELNRTGAANVGGPMRIRIRGYLSRALAAAFASSFTAGGALSHNVAYEGYVDTVFLGCWRKSTLERIGMFDENLVRNQDDECNLRLTRAGYKIWQSQRIQCWYHPRATLRALFRQQFQYGFWKVAVIRKHRLPASWRHLVPGLFVFLNILLPAAFLFGAATHVGWLRSLALAAWALMLGAYLSGSFFSAFSVASRQEWDIFPLLPVVFAIYHVAYGLGFLIGIPCCRVKASGTLDA